MVPAVLIEPNAKEENVMQMSVPACHMLMGRRVVSTVIVRAASAMLSSGAAHWPMVKAVYNQLTVSQNSAADSTNVAKVLTAGYARLQQIA